jgi:uncharacterized protein (DUF488 family)
MRIWTVGHGARPVEDLVAVLKTAGIKSLLDVRTVPGSRRHPQFGKAPLRDSLAAAGIAYEHLPGLGGRREPRPDSRHTALRVDAFRGYADHMSSDEFQRDLAVLVRRAAAAPTAFMCAEMNWTECHRRMLSDLLTVRGWEVTHLLAAGESEPHELWSVARAVSGELIYDAGTRPPRSPA